MNKYTNKLLLLVLVAGLFLPLAAYMRLGYSPCGTINAKIISSQFIDRRDSGFVTEGFTDLFYTLTVKVVSFTPGEYYSRQPECAKFTDAQRAGTEVKITYEIEGLSEKRFFFSGERFTGSIAPDNYIRDIHIVFPSTITSVIGVAVVIIIGFGGYLIWRKNKRKHP